jgi:hypothetical protein
MQGEGGAPAPENGEGKALVELALCVEEAERAGEELAARVNIGLRRVLWQSSLAREEEDRGTVDISISWDQYKTPKRMDLESQSNTISAWY